MTTYLGDVAKKRVSHVGKEQRLVTMVITCNGTGGVTSVDGDDPQCGASDGGANGDLDVTFPAFPSGQAFAFIGKSAANTVSFAHWAALDITAGTGQLITGKNSTNTDPASGDQIHIQIWGRVAP